jgi:hypothetical protein
MTEPELDPKAVAGARRRLGFVAFLWWLAAAAGTIGVVQGLSAGWVRWFFITLAWLSALFFTYAWWEVRKGRISK